MVESFWILLSNQVEGALQGKATSPHLCKKRSNVAIQFIKSMLFGSSGGSYGKLLETVYPWLDQKISQQIGMVIFFESSVFLVKLHKDYSEPRFGARHLCLDPNVPAPPPPQTMLLLYLLTGLKNLQQISLDTRLPAWLQLSYDQPRGEDLLCEEVLHCTLTAVNLPPKVGYHG